MEAEFWHPRCHSDQMALRQNAVNKHFSAALAESFQVRAKDLTGLAEKIYRLG